MMGAVYPELGHAQDAWSLLPFSMSTQCEGEMLVISADALCRSGLRRDILKYISPEGHVEHLVSAAYPQDWHIQLERPFREHELELPLLYIHKPEPGMRSSPNSSGSMSSRP